MMFRLARRRAGGWTSQATALQGAEENPFPQVREALAIVLRAMADRSIRLVFCRAGACAGLLCRFMDWTSQATAMSLMAVGTTAWRAPEVRPYKLRLLAS
jgi:hypothetical protein